MERKKIRRIRIKEELNLPTAAQMKVERVEKGWGGRNNLPRPFPRPPHDDRSASGEATVVKDGVGGRMDGVPWKKVTDKKRRLGRS